MNLYRIDTNELVALPAELENFRGEVEHVERVEPSSHPSSSGKVAIVRELEPFGGVPTSRIEYRFPGVFGCYIAAAPREATSRTSRLPGERRVREARTDA